MASSAIGANRVVASADGGEGGAHGLAGPAAGWWYGGAGATGGTARGLGIG